MLVKVTIEMTHHIQVTLLLMNYCILYLHLVVSIKKKIHGKKIHPKIKVSFILIEKQSHAHGNFLIFH